MITKYNSVKQFINRKFSKIVFFKNYLRDYSSLVRAYGNRYDNIGIPPGHYYSPIPSFDEVQSNEHKIFENEHIRDINLNIPEQFDLLQKLQSYYNSIPYNFSESPHNNGTNKVVNSETQSLRYTPQDAWYRYSDVIFLTSIMRHFKPKKIIEVGSGHSSAVMLDTNEFFLDNQIKFTFIEPFPEARLIKILKETDKENVTIFKNKIQDIDLSVFEMLEENDILFIDSSHVSKVGSDVNYIFFDILPTLKPGVIIHFHDIFYPFEYHKNWIYEKKRFWNEIYVLKAFLMNNNDYKILIFNSMLHEKYKEWFDKEMPACLMGTEETGSIWIKKIKKYSNAQVS